MYPTMENDISRRYVRHSYSLSLHDAFRTHAHHPACTNPAHLSSYGVRENRKSCSATKLILIGGYGLTIR